jgi:hypothetical protein
MINEGVLTFFGVVLMQVECLALDKIMTDSANFVSAYLLTLLLRVSDKLFGRIEVC